MIDVMKLRAAIISILLSLRDYLLPRYYTFARWIDPYLLRLLAKMGPLRDRVRRVMLPPAQRAGRMMRALWRILTAPIRGAGWLIRQILGNIRLEYVPSLWLQSLGRFITFVKQRVSQRIHSVRETLRHLHLREPVVFRVSAALVIVFGSIVGSCSTFQIYRTVTRVRVTVSGPGYKKPVNSEVPANVTIHFSAPVARLDLIGKGLNVQSEPPLAGTWSFTDDSTLQFQPLTHWPPDKEYRVFLNPEFFRSGTALADNTVKIESPAFAGQAGRSQFYIDPKDPSIKKAVVTLEFTYPVDVTSLEKNISFRYSDGLFSGRPIGHRLTVDPSGMIAYIHSDPVTIQEKDATIEFVASSGIAGKEGGRTRETLKAGIAVPGLYSRLFVSEASVRLVRNDSYELDQVLFLETTAAVSAEELAKGLSVYELPADRPGAPGTEPEKNYNWNHPDEVDPAILGKSRRISLVPVETASGDAELASDSSETAPDAATPEGTIHSFRVNVREGAYIFLRLEKGTKDLGQFVLKNTYEGIVRVPAFSREVRIMHDGAILSMAGEKKISILSYDNDVLEVEVSRVLPDQINHMVSQSYGSFKSHYFRNYNFNEENISKKYVERIQLNRQPGRRLQYAAFDFSKYVKRQGDRSGNGLFYIKVKGYLRSELTARSKKPASPEAQGPEGATGSENGEGNSPAGDNPDENQTAENESPADEATEDQPSDQEGAREDRRFILVSDLGIVVKASRSGERDVYVQSFAKGSPVNGVQIQVLGKNGIPVVSRTTDGSGHAILPSLADFKHEQAPVAMIAGAGADLSFLPFDREDRRLDFSRFDTGGIRGADERDRLSAFLFSDRGIYRPGDEIRGGMMIRSGDWRRSLAGLPVEVSVHDSRGMEVFSKVIRLSPSGFEEFHYRTEESSPTGSYEVRVSLVSQKEKRETKILLGSTLVRVEEFLPDRLRITARFSGAPGESEGWAKPTGMKGQVLLMNLFGTPAQKKKVKGTLILAPRFPSFPGYRDYRFFDPLRTNRTFRQELGTLETDDQGRVEFSLNLDRFAKGIYRATFQADGFEAAGGRAVVAATTAIVSPLDTIIGIKSEGDADYIHRGSARSISIIAIDSHLKRVAAAGIVLRIVEARHVSSLVKRQDGVYEYRSLIKEIPVTRTTVTIPATGLNVPLSTRNGGDFILTLLDQEGTELNRYEYSVVGEGNVARSLERNAELSLHLNGKDFAPGEEIEVSVRAPYAGSGLITIEKDRVYAHRWFRSTTESSIQRIRVPEGLEGNGYVNVTFVRSMESKAIYTSPLSYGIAPFSVSRRHRTARVDLQMPAEIRPGAPLNVHYSVDGPGRLVVYAVDEGILQVARYNTPNPLGHFFQKRALEVSTTQIVDQLLPEFSLVQSMMRTGGDAERLLGLNLNPFKRKRQAPVAFWSGLRDVAGEGNVSFPIPDYFNGRVHVFAVFVRDSSIGVAEKNTIVRGDFILSPSVPAFAAPGDEFEFSVNVANNLIGSGANLPVQLSARLEGPIALVKQEPSVLKISEKGEAVARFRVKSLQPGEGRLVFTAAGGGRLASQAETISVRPARPYITDVLSGMLLKDSDEIALSRDLYPDFRKLNVAVSPVPLAWSSGFYRYLSRYPYGCTEQLTSRGLAAMILKGRPELKVDPKELDGMVHLAMSVLRARQNAEGAFGFWAANSYVDSFQTAYAVLFLTEAKERGWAVPASVLANGLVYLESLLNHPADSPAADRAFALYVLTRNGKLHVNEMNGLLGEVDRIKGDEGRLPMMYLAATRKLMHQDAEANGLFDRSQPVFVKKWFMGGFDPVAASSNYMYLLSRHFPGRFPELGEKTMQSLLKDVRAGNISTISAASGILAIDAYIELRKASGLDLTVTEERADGSKHPVPFANQLFAEAPITPFAKKIHFRGNSPLPSFYQVTVAGFDRTLPTPYAEGIEVSREFTDEAGRSVHTVEVGDEVFVHVRLRSRDEERSNIALMDLFPAGMEPVQEPRENGEEKAGGKGSLLGTSAMNPDYVDMREDRALIFASAGSRATEYIYRLRAVSAGVFVVPPLYAEAMYDRRVRALTKESSFTIQGRK